MTTPTPRDVEMARKPSKADMDAAHRLILATECMDDPTIHIARALAAAREEGWESGAADACATMGGACGPTEAQVRAEAEAIGWAKGMEEAAALMCELCAEGEPVQCDGFQWGHVDDRSDPADCELTDCDASAIRARIASRGTGGE